MPDLTRSLSVLQQSQLENVQATLLRLGVPATTVDQVAAEQGPEVFSGYVWAVHTNPNVTRVDLEGSYWSKPVPNLLLLFPPNDPKWLPELIRAQNYPHFRVTVVEKGGIIKQLLVEWDYKEPKPIAGAPPI